MRFGSQIYDASTVGGTYFVPLAGFYTKGTRCLQMPDTTAVYAY